MIAFGLQLDQIWLQLSKLNRVLFFLAEFTGVRKKTNLQLTYKDILISYRKIFNESLKPFVLSQLASIKAYFHPELHVLPMLWACIIFNITKRHIKAKCKPSWEMLIFVLNTSSLWQMQIEKLSV